MRIAWSVLWSMREDHKHALLTCQQKIQQAFPPRTSKVFAQYELALKALADQSDLSSPEFHVTKTTRDDSKIIVRVLDNQTGYYVQLSSSDHFLIVGQIMAIQMANSEGTSSIRYFN